MKNLLSTSVARVGALATTAVLMAGPVMAQEDTPIEQVFEALDVATITTAVVTTGVAATGIFLAYRGILFAKRLIGRFL